MGHYLVFTGGSCAGTEVPLADNREVFIGKDPATCSVVIDKKYNTISRKHLGVRYSPEYDMYVVVDYSTNGSFVVGGSQLAKGEESYLKDGQSVNLGKTDNVFRLETRNEALVANGAGETTSFEGDYGQGDYYGYDQNGYQDPAAMYPDGKTPGKGLGLAGMILGIISLVGCICNGSVFPIVGLILSILGMKKDKEVGIKNGKATAGIVMNAIGIAFGLCGVVLAILSLFGVIEGLPQFFAPLLP